jgi:hypothetical protein
MSTSLAGCSFFQRASMAAKLGRLVLEHVQPRQVTEEKLHRDQQRHQGQPPMQHHPAFVAVHLAQQVPGAGGGDAHRAGEEGGEQHVRPAYHLHRAEDDLHPVGGDDPAVDDFMAQRHLHPAVVGQNPERREHRSQRDHAAGEEIETRRHPLAPEQHDAEESGFEHEGGERLVAEQRALDRAGFRRQHAPVGAELEGHDDAGDHAHAERHREDLEPEVEDAPVQGIAGKQPRAFDGRQPRRQPDGEGRENDVEADDKRELDARQDYGVEFHGQFPATGRGFPA